MPFSCSMHRWRIPVTLRLSSSLLTIVYAPLDAGLVLLLFRQPEDLGLLGS